MAGADRAAAEQRPQLELELGGECQRPFRADEQLRKIVHRRIGGDGVEIVAADPALHFWEARRDLVGFPHSDGEQILGQRAHRRTRRQVAQSRTDGTEMRGGAVREYSIDRQHVIAGNTIAQRAGAAGIVARHAAERGARGGGNIHREPQPVRFKLAVEIVEHDAGLDDAAPARHVEINDAVEILGAIDHQRMIDRLAALRGATAAR